MNRIDSVFILYLLLPRQLRILNERFGSMRMRLKPHRLQIKIRSCWLHVIVHLASSAEATGATGAGLASGLGTIDCSTIAICLAGHSEVLLSCCRLEGRTADPKLHHRQEHTDRRSNYDIQHNSSRRKDFMNDGWQSEKSDNGVEREDRHDCRDSQIVVTKIVSPGWYIDNHVQSVHSSMRFVFLLGLGNSCLLHHLLGNRHRLCHGFLYKA